MSDAMKTELDTLIADLDTRVTESEQEEGFSDSTLCTVIVCQSTICS
ncbi:hypothetical protein [Streptomyces iconiensis]|uniref:Uncharacterized protein n=1 Tax=Streptomyces iconiensis TaxID=1384038 RepID=A0ABT6ZPG4_9ACTN|nr:hypothetical protein [Streptomyces iconiensis]MDJ1130945.1 hypothetical protein [Streptomyces iconiensis]